MCWLCYLYHKNSQLSYEAELSWLSKSSISLAREKKNSAIFGSQQTTTLDRNLVSVKWRHRLISQLVSVLSFSTRVFFFQIDSHIFFDSNFKILTRVFFSFVNIYFANLDSCFLLHSMYFTSFDLSIMFSTCFYYRYNFVRNGTPYLSSLIIVFWRLIFLWIQLTWKKVLAF